ncbi:hypothetical protein M8818_005409 [Zalaria obscura]|uniref:Uncharacterized protein n=1 Tax=Zalaria obscura TaxID=2024903 RepID=A0ACC3S8T9_9PEZI
MERSHNAGSSSAWRSATPSPGGISQATMKRPSSTPAGSWPSQSPRLQTRANTRPKSTPRPGQHSMSGPHRRTLKLNLFARKHIEIKFSIHNSRHYDSYRIFIPLAQMTTIHETHHNDQTVFTFSLESPPKFYRMATDVEATHVSTRGEWTEQQAYFRQTDIDIDMSARNNLPVTLNKTGCRIDIGMKPIQSYGRRELTESPRSLAYLQCHPAAKPSQQAILPAVLPSIKKSQHSSG